MVDYKITETGEIIFKDGIRNMPPQKDSLWIEYIKLEYEVVNNHHNPTKDPVKIARYNELKKYFENEQSQDLLYKKKKEESEKAFDRAKEKIQQEIIASDNSEDNSVVYAAIANFKKTKE